MKHLGLFEGIGGFSLAARWMGWETIAWVEINEFCQKVLKKNFPEAKGYGDIKEFDGTPYRGTIDILTGGFPCQPFSSSGQRKGTSDDRYLWPQMLRVIREIRPSYVLAENVYGILTLRKGMVFEQVQIDLENEGYQVQAYILPACAINAPHRRDRVWFVANSNRKHGTIPIFKRGQDQTSNTDIDWPYERWTSPYSTGVRWIQSKPRHETKIDNEDRERLPWERFLIESPVRSGNDGLPPRLVRSAIEAGGNAIVPQVAYEIFKAIEQIK
jgi:DNA (cytosine-5)-methyltransferase 1